MLKGNIFNIQRFSVNDGPGIRTTVFFKGCPLNCLWCHNPESQQSEKILAFYKEKCVGCGKCGEICKNHILNDGHNIERSNCLHCGKCVSVCPQSALEIIGGEYSVDEIMDEIRKDIKYFKNSGGGVTLSGGEPLMQTEFVYEILKKSKEDGIHTCVDTSGYTDFQNLEKIAPLTDLFLYDLKETDEEKHIQFTGVSNRIIRENLQKLDETGTKIILRCPIIPSLNDTSEHYKGIANFANKLKNIEKIDVMAYHTLGKGKNLSIGGKYYLEELEPMSDTAVQQCIEAIKSQVNIPVSRG